MCIRQVSSSNVSHSFGFNAAASSAAEFMLAALRLSTLAIGVISLLHALATGNPIGFLIAGVCILTSIALFPSDVVVDHAPRAPWYHSYMPSFPFYSPSFAPPVHTYHHVTHTQPPSYRSQPWFDSFQPAISLNTLSSLFTAPSYDMAARGSLRERSYDHQAAVPSFQSSFAPSYGSALSSFAAPNVDLAQRGTLRSRG